MATRILITGGSGMVGKKLSQLLIANNYEVAWLSRSGKSMHNVKGYRWDVNHQTADNAAFENLYAIIHLAGEGIANHRWTAKQKAKIIDSRVRSAQLLFSKLEELKISPQVVISASGIGYYGYDNGNAELDESAPMGNDFVAHVVKKWEAAADQFNALGSRIAKLRIGVVLSEKGGALEKMARPIRYGVGAPLGSGQQFISWIHIDDLCRLFLFVLQKNNIEGVFNAATPYPATNKQLTQLLAKQLKRPLWLPNIPAFVLKLVLGEMNNLVLGSGKIVVDKIMATHFQFQFATLEEAFKDLLKTK